MGNTFTGKANVAEAPQGELALYLDAALSQPVDILTEIDFGTFPYKELAPGEQVLSTKSVHIWCKNEANYAKRLTGKTDNPDVVVSAPNGTVLQPDQVIDWDVIAAFKGAFDGNPIVFNVSVKGIFLPV